NQAFVLAFQVLPTQRGSILKKRQGLLLLGGNQVARQNGTRLLEPRRERQQPRPRTSLKGTCEAQRSSLPADKVWSSVGCLPGAKDQEALPHRYLDGITGNTPKYPVNRACGRNEQWTPAFGPAAPEKLVDIEQVSQLALFFKASDLSGSILLMNKRIFRFCRHQSASMAASA